jgi:hypothetical protein
VLLDVDVVDVKEKETGRKQVVRRKSAGGFEACSPGVIDHLYQGPEACSSAAEIAPFSRVAIDT